MNYDNAIEPASTADRGPLLGRKEGALATDIRAAGAPLPWGRTMPAQSCHVK